VSTDAADAARLSMTPRRHDVAAPTWMSSRLAGAVLVAVTYYAAARVGFALAVPPYFVSTLWAPNGILLAALLLTPTRSWWVVLLAAFPAHAIVELQAGLHWLIPVWYLSNVSEVVIAALLLRWTVAGPPWFDTFSRVSAFAVTTFVAAFVSTLVAAPLVLHGEQRAVYWDVWHIRLWSNMLAMLAVTPAFVKLGQGGLRRLRTMTVGRTVESGIFVLALLIVSIIVFGRQTASPGADSALLYAPVPLLLWAAIRFGTGGVSASLLVVALLTLWTAVHGRGLFIVQSPAENAAAIQLLFIMAAVALLSLAAAVRQRQQAQETALANQESARENKEQLELALRAAVMGSWEWRIAEAVITVSGESARVLGLPSNRTSLSVDEFYEIVYPDDRGSVADALSRAVLDKNSTEIEFRVVRRDGSMRWVRTKGRVVEDRMGAAVRMLGLGADVTDQKKAEALKVAQNSILEIVAVGAPLPEVLMALSSIVASQIDGVTCTVLPLDALQACAPPDFTDEDGSRPLRESGVTRNLPASWSTPILSREGTILGECVVSCAQNWMPGEDEKRLVHCVTAMASVAIERSQADDALRLSHQRYRLATTGGNVGVWDWDLRTNHVYVDPYINTMLGYEDNEIDDYLEAWVAHIHPDDVERVLGFVESRIAGDHSSYEVELRLLHKDGGVRWVAARGTVIRDANARAVRVVGTSTDVTERRRVRAELDEQQRQLAHLGRAAVLGELSGALAHELNQPLSAILANAAAAQRSLAQMEPSPTADLIQEILEDIVHDDHRAAAVIARLRSLLKKGELRVQRLDLNEVVTDVLELVHSDLIERRVLVESRLAAGLPVVVGDRVQAQQVLLNLILNACDAMSDNVQGDRVLRIVTEMCDGNARLSIVDRGRGIPEATMDRIFEPFVTSKEDGLGLGLAICRSIMRAHGGRLWATNNLADGATFCVEFPRERSGVAPERQPMKAPRPELVYEVLDARR
jgi:PAS domain S-box-containing protein